MALERLQSVFNDIYQNEARSTDDSPSPSIDQIGDDHSYGSNGFFDSINQVLQPDGTYQRYGNIPIRASADASPMSRKLLLSQEEPSLNYSGYENENGVTVRDVDGISRLYEGLIPVGEGGESIRHFYDKGENIGKKNLLGVKGSGYELSDIFDPTHRGNYNNITRLFGQGSTKYLDIRASQQDGVRVGAGNLKEPYVVNSIPNKGGNSIKSGYNRDSLPYNATLDDIQRFLKYQLSPKGLLSILKENVTNYAIGDSEAFDIPSNPTFIPSLSAAGIMVPPIPILNTGFLNFYQQTLQGNGLVPGAGSLRKPFKIEYSNKIGKIVALATQGDSTSGIAALEKIKIPEAKSKLGKVVVRGLQKLKDVGIINLEKSAQLPLFEKPTSFIKPEFNPLRFDPFTGDVEGNESTTVDYINRSRYMDEEKIDLPAFKGNFPPLETDLKNPIKKGDFYVRFKDLRNNKFLYFRGFITGINENITPSFNPTQYIGRSEDVYTYQKAERDLSFNLKVYPQNQIEFDAQYEKINALTSLAYPSYLNDGGGNLRMKAPFTEMYMAHIGTRAEGQFGFIKSLTYTIPESGDWDAFSALPRMFDIAISYQIINKRPPQLGTQFYRGTGEVLTVS